MAVTTARIDMKDVYLYIFTREDTDGAASSYLFKFSQGDFTYSVKKGYEFITDRGLLITGSVRSTDEVPCDVKFEGEYETVFSDEGTPSPYEILMGEEDCAGWVGLGYNTCEPYATWLACINDPLIRLPGCAAGEGLLFKYFFCESADFATKAGTCSFSGKCRVVAPKKITQSSGSFTTHDEAINDSETITLTFLNNSGVSLHDHSA